MHPSPFTLLDRTLTLPGLEEAHRGLKELRGQVVSHRDGPRLRQLYREAATHLERELWRRGADPVLLDLYQALFREMEAQLAGCGPDPRHDFVVVIPVADRPVQLRQCLHSLLTLCRTYRYGGIRGGCFVKVRVLICDDSRRGENVHAHRVLAGELSGHGLRTRHLSAQEQQGLLEDLGPGLRRRLAGVVNDGGHADFSHKGASITRNLACLWLARQPTRGPDTLYWFVDSDQEFQVLIKGSGGDRELYALNYFHQLDRVFREREIQILTGKVVGAPPVSPAVMAGNLLEDLRSLLLDMDRCAPDDACGFHPRRAPAGGAPYHDMADLFGFAPSDRARTYACPLGGPHSHADCLEELAGHLDGFFDGDHPTRRLYFDYREPLSSLQPARTVYTGNYVLRPTALDWFIPFAPLKLRMAGPVLGRLVRSELSRGFVACNLPLLHKRTLTRQGQAEYRTGVCRQEQRVDLSGEQARQYAGDLMLFTMERLVASGYPTRPLGRQEISRALQQVDTELRARYRCLHREIVTKLEELEPLVKAATHWWNQLSSATARDGLMRFLDNLRSNFGDGSAGLERIDSGDLRTALVTDLARAIDRYGDDREAWAEALRRCARS